MNDLEFEMRPASVSKTWVYIPLYRKGLEVGELILNKEEYAQLIKDKRMVRISNT